MKHSKLLDIIGTLTLGIGMIIAVSSHAFHARIGLGEETSHLTHIILGMALVILGLGILVWNNKALKWMKK